MEYREYMRWTNTILAAAGVVLMSSDLQAVPAAQLKENYQSIIERNPFGLKPPPPPPTNAVPEVKEKPKLEVFLTGITSIGYPKLPKQAYFYTREQGKKDITMYALSEGDGKDGIQVLNIDPEGRKVRVKMDNAETLLSFETHGVPIAAAPGKTPGVPALPVPGQHPGQPAAQPLPMPGGHPNPQQMYDPNGQPVYNNAPQPVTQPMNSYNTGAGMRQIPSRRIRGGGSNPYGGTPPAMDGGMQQPQAAPIDPAEDYVRMHLNRAAKERETGVQMPPLPVIQ